MQHEELAAHMTELTNRRKQITARRVALEKKQQLRDATMAEFSSAYTDMLRRKLRLHRQNEVASKKRNQHLAGAIDDYRKQNFGPGASTGRTSALALQKAKQAFVDKVEAVYPAWQEQLQQLKLQKLRQLEQEKKEIEHRRLLAKQSFEKEQALELLLRQTAQDITIAATVERNEAYERQLYRQQKEAVELEYIIQARADEERRRVEGEHLKALVVSPIEQYESLAQKYTPFKLQRPPMPPPRPSSFIPEEETKLPPMRERWNPHSNSYQSHAPLVAHTQPTTSTAAQQDIRHDEERKPTLPSTAQPQNDQFTGQMPVNEAAAASTFRQQFTPMEASSQIPPSSTPPSVFARARIQDEPTPSSTLEVDPSPRRETQASGEIRRPLELEKVVESRDEGDSILDDYEAMSRRMPPQQRLEETQALRPANQVETNHIEHPLSPSAPAPVPLTPAPIAAAPLSSATASPDRIARAAITSDVTPPPMKEATDLPSLQATHVASVSPETTHEHPTVPTPSHDTPSPSGSQAPSPQDIPEAHLAVESMEEQVSANVNLDDSTNIEMIQGPIAPTAEAHEAAPDNSTSPPPVVEIPDQASCELADVSSEPQLAHPRATLEAKVEPSANTPTETVTRPARSQSPDISASSLQRKEQNASPDMRLSVDESFGHSAGGQESSTVHADILILDSSVKSFDGSIVHSSIESLEPPSPDKPIPRMTSAFPSQSTQNLEDSMEAPTAITEEDDHDETTTGGTTTTYSLTFNERLSVLQLLIPRIETAAKEGEHFFGAPESIEMKSKQDLLKMAMSGRKVGFFGGDVCFALLVDICRDIGPYLFPERIFEGKLTEAKLIKEYKTCREKEMDYWKLLSAHMKEILSSGAVPSTEVVQFFTRIYLAHVDNDPRLTRKLKEFLSGHLGASSKSAPATTKSAEVAKVDDAKPAAAAGKAKETPKDPKLSDAKSVLDLAFMHQDTSPSKKKSSDNILKLSKSPKATGGLGQRVLRGISLDEFSEFDDDNIDLGKLIGSSATNKATTKATSKPTSSTREMKRAPKDDDFDEDF
ncbi:hypothetical protein AC1031_000343 [Aphanomyces cochlioides]|nr:hypothetical protein AC1031_000343 [Aphanomyces cochlioides]